MICTLLILALVVATVYAVVRHRDLKPLLILWGLFLLLLAGMCAASVVALVDYSESSKITKCRTPLVGDTRCSGFNDSWIECRWAFRAEGRPEPALCQHFLQLPAGYQGTGDTTDYDDVRSFSEVVCPDSDALEGTRCFQGIRREHEATNRYLLSFDPNCSAAVVLRSCNQDLKVAKRFAEETSR